ncbi:MAG: iron-sulfur cluster repair di-iron protein [Phycisphaerae bacterium]|nr:iron-sulfur cluster repair di-iron protein [Phycisphaerae bacterium]
MTLVGSPFSVTVGQLVAERPERGRVFERLGIDYCCGGRKLLAEACAQRGLDTAHVQALLEASDAVPSAGTQPDWSTVPLSQLVDDIVSTHHESMRHELPRLSSLVQKVAAVHGATHAGLTDLNRIFSEFVRELILHMSKEESLLFPWICGLEAGSAHRPRALVPIDQPIHRMIQEHDDAGRALEAMRELTNGFTPPPDACGTYRVMLSGLRDLEADMHTHVHKENNILFPRAVALDTGGKDHL